MANISKEMIFSEHNLRMAFNYFDEDKNGAISIDELLDSFNGLIDEKSISKVLKGFDIDNDGEVDLKRFHMTNLKG